MTTQRHRPGVAGWARTRPLLMVAAFLLAGTVLLGGLDFYVDDAATVPGRPAANPTNERDGRSTGVAGADSLRRDAIAVEPMLVVGPDAARPTAPAADPAPAILIPPASGTGPAEIPSGFPHTPEGAVGQLAAITTGVLARMSLPYTHTVHRHWTLPGAVPAGEWELTQAVQAFLDATNQGVEKDSSVSVIAIPAGGMVKGTDGPDWVLGCVLLEVRATITAEARIGYGQCARLQWHHGRWMIAPGTPPATAPSTWPGSELAAQAGWHTWAEL